MTDTQTPLVEMRDIDVSFGGVKAVDGVTVDLYPGEVVGLLGHNGAGKTTIMKMLSGYLEPSAGTINIDGMELSENTRRVLQRMFGRVDIKSIAG